MALPAVWSSQLFAGTVTGGGTFVTLYTVPAAKVLILRTISVKNLHAGDNRIEIGIAGLVTMHANFSLATDESADWDTWHVLEETQVLNLWPIDGDVSVLASGQLLTKP